MEERLILKSEQRKLKIVAILLIIAGCVFYLNAVYYMAHGIHFNVTNFYDQNPTVRDLYDSRMDYIFYIVGSHFDSFLELFCIGSLLVIAGILIKKKLSKCLLILSNKAVYGFDFWGRRVELPLAQVTAIKKCVFGGIEISHSTGKIKFLLMKNRDTVFAEVVKALNSR